MTDPHNTNVFDDLKNEATDVTIRLAKLCDELVTLEFATLEYISNNSNGNPKTQSAFRFLSALGTHLINSYRDFIRLNSSTGNLPDTWPHTVDFLNERQKLRDELSDILSQLISLKKGTTDGN